MQQQHPDQRPGPGSVAELAAAAQAGLALPVVVVDNGGYGEIRRAMLERGDTPLAVDLGHPDFPGLARSLGCHGVTTEDPERLTAELRWEPPARPADGNGGAAGHGTASGSAASDGQGEARYPHLYGPIDPDAVVTIVQFAPDSDGRFTAMPVLA